MRAWLAAALVATAGAGEARGWTIDGASCETLRALLVAANERPAFRSLDRHGLVRAAAGLGLRTCRLDADLLGNRLTCEGPADPPHLAGAALEARIGPCVPRALQMREAEGSPLTRFRLGTLAFHVERLPGVVRFRLFALPVERR